MRIYISGKITENENYKQEFEEAENWLTAQGYDVVNPAKCCDYPFFTYAEFMEIDIALLKLCDAIFMLANWQQSNGAKTELAVAKSLGKIVKYQRYFGRRKQAEEKNEDRTI
jgi:hypothetical protein